MEMLAMEADFVLPALSPTWVALAGVVAVFVVMWRWYSGGEGR